MEGTMAAKAVTEREWETEVLQSPTPVLVDFWAIWCGPCRLIAPIVEELAVQYAGKLKVLKVDVDQEQSLAIRYGIMSIPTLLLFKGGQVVEQIVGALPRHVIEERIRRHLA
jgi:thioredoxin 1